MEAKRDEFEEARQAELDSLKLESFVNTAFDDIVRTARDICRTPVALVSIVDRDRQWFKARVGLDATETTETPREISFCTHTIQRPDRVMVVEDASKDPRFADNPLVVGAPGIRFYAGAPLTMESGLAMGTVCVVDTQPHRVDEKLIEELRFLASQVVAVLERRKKSLPSSHT